MAIDVIVINDFAEANGGAAQVALASAFALAESGHRVTLFSAVTPGNPVPIHQNLNVVVTAQHEIAADPIRLRAMVQGVWNAKARRLMRITLESFHPANTVVHLHGWSKALSSSVVRECVKRGFRVICTLHDYFVACPNGGFYNFRTNEICHLRALSLRCVLENCDSRNYAQKTWRVARQVIQTGLGKIPDGISAFITVSRFSKDILRSYLPSDRKIFHVQNPVISVRNPPACIVEHSPFLYLGRLSPEKGGEMLASASADLSCEMIFVGDGVARAKIAACNSRARMTGWLPHAEALKRLEKARSLVLPSLWYETQGLVVLEAAALGIPAIVPDTSAARDLVKDGHTGLWFRGGDELSLRAAMKRLIVTSVAQAMGREAYEAYWTDPPTISKHISKLRSVYSEVLLGIGA